MESTLLLFLICSLFFIHMKVCHLISQPPKEKELRNPSSYVGINRTPHSHFCLRQVALSIQPLSPLGWSITRDLSKTQSRLLDRAYLVTAGPLDEMLNFFNSSFFRLIAFLITYLFTAWYKVVKLVIIVEGDQKAPFSIATAPRCRGGCYSFPWIDTYLILLSVKQGGIKYHF